VSEFAATRYNPGAAAEWDELVARASMGTLLHTRRYLSYHGDRFDDRSLLMCDRRGRLQAVLPAATDPEDRGVVFSHPGVTYGGLVHDGALSGTRALDALATAAAHYAEEGFRSLRYKAVPRIYHRRPADDDLYALFRHDAVRYRVDLSCAVEIANRATPSARRRRTLRRAERAGVRVGWTDDRLSEFMEVVTENLETRHGLQPVHTVTELEDLRSRFPSEIRLLGATIDDELVGGMLLFVTPTTLHAQYIASSSLGRSVGAVDAVAEAAIDVGRELSARYFNLGISTEDEGRLLNEGLHSFKAEFGGGGVVHEFFELDLEPFRST
jgi:hypothetical protein